MGAKIVDDLVQTDKLCDRWGQERRDRDPSIKCTLHNMALQKEGVVLEGPFEMSDESLLVDRIFLSSPKKEQAVLVIWYCDPAPVVIKAKKLKIHRSQIYVVWGQVLQYVRGRLHELGLKV